MIRVGYLMHLFRKLLFTEMNVEVKQNHAWLWFIYYVHQLEAAEIICDHGTTGSRILSVEELSIIMKA